MFVIAIFSVSARFFRGNERLFMKANVESYSSKNFSFFVFLLFSLFLFYISLYRHVTWYTPHMKITHSACVCSKKKKKKYLSNFLVLGKHCKPVWGVWILFGLENSTYAHGMHIQNSLLYHFIHYLNSFLRFSFLFFSPTSRLGQTFAFYASFGMSH